MIGMLTENYVASSLKYNGLNLNYWKNEYDSKIDFVLQSEKGKIIPVVVKSSTHTKARSLSNYISEYNQLYAVFCINENNLDIEKYIGLKLMYFSILVLQNNLKHKKNKKKDSKVI